MSLYQLNKCVYDWVRAGEVNSAAGGDGRVGFDASTVRAAPTTSARPSTARDVAGLYQLGLHRVLLNRFCRAAGFARDDYRKLLEPFGEKEERRGRWQR